MQNRGMTLNSRKNKVYVCMYVCAYHQGKFTGDFVSPKIGEVGCV